MLNFPFVCRLCLVPTSPNNSIEIFDESDEIPEKILELTDIQGTWGMPATTTNPSSTTNTPSYGTQFQADFNKNLATVMSNLHNGVTTLATPPIKFGLDTVPNLFHQGISTAADKVNKISAASKEGLQKLGVGAGQAVGGGAVLGSSLVGGGMNLLGSGLGVGVNVADAGSKATLDFLGHVGDNTASTISVGSSIGGDALSTLGNGMIAAGSGVNVVTSGLATLLDVVGGGLSKGIIKTEQVISGLMDAGVLKLENGALTFSTSAQASIYNILNSFLQILVNLQKLFDSLKVNIDANVTPGVTGAASTNTGSAAQTASNNNTPAAQTASTTPAAAKSTRGLVEPEEAVISEPTTAEVSQF